MIASLVIVFREVLEAGLIIGVVLAAAQGVPGRNRAVTLGVLAGILGSMIVALFAARISSAFDGRGQELFAAGVLGFAVLMLAWHVVWMADHAKEMTQQLKTLGSEVVAGRQSLFALGAAVSMAVMREGSEVVLFLTGIFMQSSEGVMPLILGSLAGLVLGAVVSAVLYLGLAAVPLKRMFSVTGALVTLLAGGLAAEAVKQLSNAGLISILDTPLWNSSWLLSESSWPGRILQVLIGYRDSPTGMQVLVYLVTIVSIFALARYKSRGRESRATKASPSLAA